MRTFLRFLVAGCWLPVQNKPPFFLPLLLFFINFFSNQQPATGNLRFNNFLYQTKLLVFSHLFSCQNSSIPISPTPFQSLYRSY